MKISETTVYLTDNGAAYCGAHLGMTAKMTGRDISGQKILAVTPKIAALSMLEYGQIACEQCGRVATD